MPRGTRAVPVPPRRGRACRALTALLLGGLATLAGLAPAPARAWSEGGHRAIALVAQHYLHSRTRERIEALLSGDDTALVPDRGLASESVWADRWRDADRYGSKVNYLGTRQWHFVNLPLLPAGQPPDLSAACFGRPPLPEGSRASTGPARACIVDKIEQFRATLASREAPRDERRRALQFLLHLVGDVHQPLHTIDDGDHGGNDRQVLVGRSTRPISLHSLWDHHLVRSISRDPQVIADRLVQRIRPADLRLWRSQRSADAWALESHEVARREVYATLPAPGEAGASRLTAAQYQAARELAEARLQRAGVRLALLLNETLGR